MISFFKAFSCIKHAKELEEEGNNVMPNVLNIILAYSHCIRYTIHALEMNDEESAYNVVGEK